MFFRSLAAFVLISTEFVPGQTMFHGNPAHMGVYDSAGPTQSATVKWAFHTGGPIVASAAITDGVVYITSMDGHVYAIDQETGKEK
jgi:eukaryotic-like serine/threonine-protein kinase